MTSSFYIPVLPPASTQRSTAQPERHVQRRVNANGTVSQMEVGSDGASRTIDVPPPNMFDLFGKRPYAPSALDKPAMQTDQQTPEKPLQLIKAGNEKNGSESKEETNAKEQAAAESVSETEQQEKEAKEASHLTPKLTDVQGDSHAEQVVRQDSSPSSDAAFSTEQAPTTSDNAAHLQKLVSQLTVRMSVQDSSAEISLDKLIEGFPSTVVQMRQVGASLQVTCKCESEAEAEWFSQHGGELSRLLTERLRRKVQFSTDNGSASDDRETGAKGDDHANS